MTFTVIGGPPAGITGDQGDVLMVETPGLVGRGLHAHGIGHGHDGDYQCLGLVADITIQSDAVRAGRALPATASAIHRRQRRHRDADLRRRGFGDSLTIVGTDGDDTIVHTPHAGIDEGHVRVNTCWASVTRTWASWARA
jgi:hypothetical protein